jgi:general secretion pathway protein A
MDRYHFTTKPFTREIRTEHRFKVDGHEQEIKALKAAVHERASGVLISPAGGGKSVVLRALEAELPSARHRVSYIKLNDLGARDMCRQIAMFIGTTPCGSYPALVHAIEKRIRSGFDDEGLRQVLIIDEAHDLRPQVLRLLRLLTNFDKDSRLVISVILAGQPPLKEKLLRPEMEDIRQRMGHFGELAFLSREETKSYIDYRCKIAGASKSPFDTQATEAIYEIARGNMRATDELALQSLAIAAAAERDLVDSSDVALARTKRWM